MDGDTDADGLIDADGLRDFDEDADGLIDADGLMDADIELDGLIDALGLTDDPGAKYVVCPNSLLPTVPMAHPPPGGLYGRDGDADADGLRDRDAELDGLMDALGLRDADGLRDMVYPEHTSTRTGHAACVMKTKDERRIAMYVC
jgi:hypothetical protein